MILNKNEFLFNQKGNLIQSDCIFIHTFILEETIF